MRIAIGMIAHETNIFRAGLTEVEHCQARAWRVGGAIIRSDPPGSTSSTLHSLPCQRVQRSIWPLAGEATMEG